MQSPQAEPAVVLAPEETTDVTVTFFPTSAVAHCGTLSVKSDDPEVSVNLIGNLGHQVGAVEDQATVLTLPEKNRGNAGLSGRPH